MWYDRSSRWRNEIFRNLNFQYMTVSLGTKKKPIFPKKILINNMTFLGEKFSSRFMTNLYFVIIICFVFFLSLPRLSDIDFNVTCDHIRYKMVVLPECYLIFTWMLPDIFLIQDDNFTWTLPNLYLIVTCFYRQKCIT